MDQNLFIIPCCRVTIWQNPTLRSLLYSLQTSVLNAPNSHFLFSPAFFFFLQHFKSFLKNWNNIWMETQFVTIQQTDLCCDNLTGKTKASLFTFDIWLLGSEWHQKVLWSFKSFVTVREHIRKCLPPFSSLIQILDETNLWSGEAELKLRRFWVTSKPGAGRRKVRKETKVEKCYMRKLVSLQFLL